MFQKVARFAIKWTFDIREEISHFSKNMSQFRLRSSIERTLNRQLSRTGDDMGLINVWDNFVSFIQQSMTLEASSNKILLCNRTLLKTFLIFIILEV